MNDREGPNLEFCNKGFANLSGRIQIAVILLLSQDAGCGVYQTKPMSEHAEAGFRAF